MIVLNFIVFIAIAVGQAAILYTVNSSSKAVDKGTWSQIDEIEWF